MKKLFENWRRYTYLAEATQWSQYQRVMDMLRGDVDAVDEISILTPENPHAKKDYPQEQNDARTELFLGMMSSAGFGYRQIDGMYDNAEVSYVVPHMSIDEAAKYSYMFEQESFVYSVKQDAEKPMLHQLIVIDGYEKIGENSCVALLSKPIRNSAYWGKKIFVDQKLWQIRKIEYFSSESIISKTLFLNEIVNKGSYWLPTVLEMHKPNGNHTIMKLEAFKPDAVLDDEIFTESFLIQKN